MHHPMLKPKIAKSLPTLMHGRRKKLGVLLVPAHLAGVRSLQCYIIYAMTTQLR